MKVLTVGNYKGGVAKTCTALNLATIYASQGKRVLLIDLDPQANATDFFGLYDRAREEKRSIVEVLYQGLSIREAAHATDTPNLSIVPASLDLIDQNELLLSENVLRYALQDVSDDYDIAITDCNPMMKRVTLCSFIASADGGLFLIPVKVDASIVRGISNSMRAAEMAARAVRLNPPKVKLVRTIVPGSKTIGQQTGEQILNGLYPNDQMQTAIHASTKVVEGTWKWKPVVEYSPKSRPARDYLALAEEVEHVLCS